MITTDAAFLRQPSVIDSKTDVVSIVRELLDNLPEHAAGLAAPQLSYLARIFVAKLSKGVFAFVDPKFAYRSPDTFSSTEGCLSVPDKHCCIERHQRVTITAQAILPYTLLDGNYVLKEHKNDLDYENNEACLKLSGFDASVVQHEMDHLDGILITDVPAAKTVQQKLYERQKSRFQRIAKNRSTRSQVSVPHINPKRAAKLNKMHKQQDRQRRKSVQIQEERRIENENLFP